MTFLLLFKLYLNQISMLEHLNHFSLTLLFICKVFSMKFIRKLGSKEKALMRFARGDTKVDLKAAETRESYSPSCTRSISLPRFFSFFFVPFSFTRYSDSLFRPRSRGRMKSGSPSNDIEIEREIVEIKSWEWSLES